MKIALPAFQRGLLVTTLCTTLGLAHQPPAYAQGYGSPYAPPSGGVRPIDQSPRPYVPLYQPPIWEGLYLGSHLGGDFGAGGGATGGAHLGYNWHRNSFVVGLEMDADFKSLHGSASVPGLVTAQANQDWQSSLRLRLGYSVGPALLYATGGLAAANLAIDVNDRGTKYARESIIRGLVLGGGIEMKFAPNISGRIEALHYSFAEQSFDFPTVRVRGDVDTTTVRAGISYHFN